MAFLDIHNNPVLPRLDHQGKIRISDEADDSILAALLLEMRGCRIGLEILNRMKTGELLELAQNEAR